MQNRSIGKISAVIPTFNRAAEVMNAVDSVLAQTLAVDEVIVVDDGSTDGSAELLRLRYGAAITVIRQPNRGVSAARNAGLSIAKGDWVAFLDSDDVWFPEKTEKQCEVLCRLGSEYGMCFSDCLYSEHPNDVRNAFFEVAFRPSETMGQLTDPAGHILRSTSPLRIQSVIVRRSLLQMVGGFDEAVTVMEDMDLFFHLSFRTKFCYLAEPLVRIDRSPSRPDPLCSYFSSRNPRADEDLRHIYQSWLLMREVIGTDYERETRRVIRLLSFNSVESGLRSMDLPRVFRAIQRLRDDGDTYGRIVTTLVARKVAKLRRNHGNQHLEH